MSALISKLSHANARAYMSLVSTFVTSKMLGHRVAQVALSLTAALALTSSIAVAQQQETVGACLKGFDSYMDQVMKDWNAPAIGIGIVMADKFVFAKGYAFRDYGKKLPYTTTTTQPIASNSKLFTAVFSFTVERGKVVAMRERDPSGEYVFPHAP